MDRISRRDYYLLIAKIASLRSTCSRGKNGCVLVDQETNRLVSIGYNGSPRGSDHCDDVGCLISNNKDHGDSCIRTTHAEVQATAFMRGRFNSLVAYCTTAPCISCLKSLVSVNVKEIYFMNNYVSKDRDKLLQVYRPSIKWVKCNDIKEDGWKKIGSLFGYLYSNQEPTL